MILSPYAQYCLEVSVEIDFRVDRYVEKDYVLLHYGHYTWYTTG